MLVPESRRKNLQIAWPPTFAAPAAAGGVAAIRRRLAGAALVLLLFAAPLFYRLGLADLDNDEAIYGHAVLSIVQHGAWGSPWSSPGSGPFLEKPPLQLWLAALGIVAGLPADELGLRFTSASWSALALLYLYLLGFRAGGLAGGIAAAATLFLFHPVLVDHGLRSVTMDAALLLAYCGGAFHLARWSDAALGERRGRRHFLAAVLFFTFGFLVKFVAALFLPLAAGVTLLLLPEGRRRLLAEWRLIVLGGGWFGLLAAPWFLYQNHQHGALFWRILIGQHVVERFTHHLDPAHVHPFGFYFATFTRELAAAGTLPWVLAGLLCWLVALAAARPSFVGLFVPVWALLPLFSISLGTSKLIHYAYPFLPPLGLFAAYAAGRAAALAGALLDAPAPRRRLAGLAVALVAAALAAPPAARYLEELRGLGRAEHPLRDFAACLGRGEARTLVDEGRREALVFLHAFLSDGVYHPLAFYSRRGAELQQLDTPDDRLLFFRLYLPPHQAATVVPEPLWRSFREHLEDPGFRAAIVAEAGGLGAAEETARLLADPATLAEPPSFSLGGFRYFLPGPYVACLPPG